MVKSWKRHRGQSKSKHHTPRPGLPYKAPVCFVEGGKPSDNLPLTHPESQRPFPLFPTAPNTINLWLFMSFPESPKDSLEMPQQHVVIEGNRAWTCHLPVGGSWKSSVWPVTPSCLLNSLFLQAGLRWCWWWVKTGRQGSRNVKCELHKIWTRTAPRCSRSQLRCGFLRCVWQVFAGPH